MPADTMQGTDGFPDAFKADSTEQSRIRRAFDRHGRSSGPGNELTLNKDGLADALNSLAIDTSSDDIKTMFDKLQGDVHCMDSHGYITWQGFGTIVSDFITEVNADWRCHPTYTIFDALTQVLPLRSDDRLRTVKKCLFKEYNNMRALAKYMHSQFAMKNATVHELESKAVLMMSPEDHLDFLQTVQLGYSQEINRLQGIIHGLYRGDGPREFQESDVLVPTTYHAGTSPDQHAQHPPPPLQGVSSSSTSPLQILFNEDDEQWTNPATWSIEDVTSIVWGLERYGTSWWCFRQLQKPELAPVQLRSITDMKAAWNTILGSVREGSPDRALPAEEECIQGGRLPQVDMVDITEATLGTSLFQRIMMLRDSITMPFRPSSAGFSSLGLSDGEHGTPSPEAAAPSPTGDADTGRV